jgi:hypothetical protein
LPELLGAAAGEPLQVEVPPVRLLFELLGFLLKFIAAAIPTSFHPQQLKSEHSAIP